jgi:hypothetical protein
MSGIVLMFRDSRELYGRDLYSCSDLDWRLLYRIGTTFGWQPRGTTYQLAQGSKIVTPALHDYEPGEPADRKQVDRDDAVEWARSLKAAKRSGHLAAILDAHVTAQPADANASVASLNGLIDEFAEYAFGGAFSFAKEGQTPPSAE